MTDFFINIFEHFTDPRKRIFLGYLLIAIIIAFFWLITFRGLSARQSFKYIFNRKILLSRSSGADLKLFFFNRVFVMFISPMLITQLAIATVIFHFLHTISWLSNGMYENFSKLIVIILFTSFLFLVDDFTKFIVHRWMHKWPLLWSLHKVHHSATSLTPLTIYRTHPLEGIVFALRGSFTQGLSISTFVFLFGDQVDLYTVLGVNVFIFIFNVAGSNLRHSHIGIQYWKWLEYLLISPAQHQLHHSVALEHHDKNFGATLAVWDWVFGSLHHSEATEDLTLGIYEIEEKTTHSFYHLFVYPFFEIGSIIINKLKRIILIVFKSHRNSP